ncbi:MAG: hypothetical protein HUU35_09370 [Armatimonadetes bacterium]|nr:hypothetical protein [Armatimonadota bacterium]
MATCAIGMSLILLTLAGEPANLAPNPTLEAPVTDGLPTGWTLFGSPEGSYTPTVVEPGHTAGHGWQMDARGEYAGAVVVKVPLRPDQLYLGGAWVMVRGTGSATVKIDYWRGDTWLGDSSAPSVTAEQGWQEVRTADRRAKYPEATEVALALLVQGGQAVFDDLFFHALPRPDNDAGNLLVNGTFERGVGTTLSDGGTACPEGEKPTLNWTAEAARSGLRGVRLRNDQGYFVLFSEALPLDRSKVYTLSGWVRARAGYATLKVDFLDDNGWLGQQAAEAVAADGQWTRVSLVVDPTLQPTATRLAAAAVVDGAGGDADVDDLALHVAER